MFRNLQQRNESGGSEGTGFLKRSDSSGSNALGYYLKLRKLASARFLSLDLGPESSAESVYKIEPFGKKRELPDKVDLKTDLDWSIVAPRDGQYSEILLEAGKFHDEDFVIEDFGLGSPHAWKRMF